MKLISYLTFAGIAACAGPTPKVTYLMPYEDVGEVSSAVTSIIQHPLANWWSPPEWGYHPESNTFVSAMQSIDSNWVTVPEDEPLHCASATFTGLTAVGGLCDHLTQLQVRWHGDVDVYFEDISPGLYWQQPGGGAFGTVFPYTMTAMSIPIMEPLPPFISGNPARNGAPWLPSDLGCNTLPHQNPIAGLCFAGTASLDTPIEDFYIEIRYVQVK